MSTVDKVIEFIDDYLNRLPVASRVTYEDLVLHICTECGFPNRELVRELIRNAVNTRDDLVVNRGRGICKYKRR